MNNHIEALSYYLGAFVDELTRLDVCDVVISQAHGQRRLLY